MSMPIPFEVSVVGVSWHQETIASVKIGDEVEIRPDPLNPHDVNARVVMSAKGALGHLSRAVAARLAKDHPGVLHGVIVERLGTVTTGLRLNVTSEDVVAPVAPPNEPVGVPEVDLSGASVVSVRASGRVLGRLVREDLEGVHVLLDDGGEVVLDAAVVEISAYVGPVKSETTDKVAATSPGVADFDLD
jgi:hypothetical protein